MDSTNNYAMRLIDANKAQHGLTIVAGTQWGGRGQRGRTWADEPGKSLLMSIIAQPGHQIHQQFEFNATVALAIVNVLQNLYHGWQVAIKWPNDIIVNDKKAAGVLIENILRGSQWYYSVIGLGLNVGQQAFPAELPVATSLRIASGMEFTVPEIRDALVTGILAALSAPVDAARVLDEYNAHLYRRGHSQQFRDAAGDWEAIVAGAGNDGTLILHKADGSEAKYQHGQAEWVW